MSLFASLYKRFAQEELEIDKLLEAENASGSSPAKQAQYQEIKDDLVEQAKGDDDADTSDGTGGDDSSGADGTSDDSNSPDDASTSDDPADTSSSSSGDEPSGTDDPGNDGQSDNGTESKKSTEPSSDDSGEKNSDSGKGKDIADDSEQRDMAGDEEKVAKEAIVSDKFVLPPYAEVSMSFESWEDVGYHSKNISAGIFNGLKALAIFGITHGSSIAMKIIKTLYKGVIWSLIKLAKSFHHGVVLLGKSYERRRNSYDNVKAQLEALTAELEKKDDPEEEVKDTYTNSHVINHLKIGDSVDFTANVTAHAEFMDRVIQELNTGVKNDAKMIQYLTTEMARERLQAPSSVLTIDVRFKDMSERIIEGYETPSETLHTLTSNTSLPGDVVLIAHLPNAKMDTQTDFTEAYNHAKVFYGMDMSKFVSVENVNYMTKSELQGFLAALTSLNEMLHAHEYFYKDMLLAKKKMRLSFGNYVQSLVSSGEKVSLKHSLADVINLRTMFMDKVYLVAAVDTHDYAVRVISVGLTLAKDHIKKLTDIQN